MKGGDEHKRGYWIVVVRGKEWIDFVSSSRFFPALKSHDWASSSASELMFVVTSYPHWRLAVLTFKGSTHVVPHPFIRPCLHISHIKGNMNQLHHFYNDGQYLFGSKEKVLENPRPVWLLIYIDESHKMTTTALTIEVVYQVLYSSLTNSSILGDLGYG